MTLADASLAERLVVENFAVRGGELCIGGLGVREIVSRAGSPVYVYDGDVIERRYEMLSRAVGGLAQVYYSIKANPNPAIAGLIAGCGAGLEIASGAELLLARAAGCTAERVLFAGPGKGEAELEMAIGCGIGEIHLECFEEIELVAAIARRLARRVSVSIRVNPGKAAQGGAMRMGGQPAAFGFDEEIMGEVVAAVGAHPELVLDGLHLFAGTQILDAGVLLGQWAYGMKLAAQLAGLAGRPLASIDLGGGLGIPYHQGDGELDLARVAQGALGLAAAQRADPAVAAARVIIEPGRYLVGPAGVYLASVRAVKRSRGERFVIADGGMHHHLAASGNLGQVIKRDYPIVGATRIGEAGSPARLVGPLCTPLDTLGRQTALPSMVAGDLVAVLQSGAYGLSASPVGFLSHPMPAEVLVQGGEAHVIRGRGTFSAPLVNPV